MPITETGDMYTTVQNLGSVRVFIFLKNKDALKGIVEDFLSLQKFAAHIYLFN